MRAQLIIRRPSKRTEHAVDLSSFGSTAELRIGRDSQNDIQIPLPFFSSQHLRIFAEGNHWYAEDMGSTNGTTYRGQRLVPGTPVKWDTGIPLSVQDLELTLTRDISYETLAHTGSLARRLLADDTDPNQSDLAFFEIQNGPHTGRRFVLADHIENFCFKVTSNTIQEDPHGNVTVTRNGDGFALTTQLEFQCDKKAYTSGTRIHSGSRLCHAATEMLFYDPLEDLLPAPQIPLQTDDVRPVLDAGEATPGERTPEKQTFSKTEWLAMTLAVVGIVIGLAILSLLFG